MHARASDGRWARRFRFDTPRRRATHLVVAVLLVIGGLSLAVLSDATPTVGVSPLATSGSFFALAESGSTLYAATDNGGSVLLEKSTDQGGSWTAAPVPYSVVAGGAPWTSAAVAVDGPNLVLAAATGGSVNPPYLMDAELGSCAENSTVLLASSPDGGLTWSTLTLVTENLSVTSLQAGIVGEAAAVAWLGESTACGTSTGAAQAVTSLDGGASWSAVQPIGVPRESVPVGEEVEMAPDSQGIVIAFGLTSTSNGTSELGLWSFASGGSSGFVRTTVLPAPTAWTLQGSTDTPAYLLTPTYLVPLTSPPYTALPFDQLQADSPSVGLLPDVVSVVPLGSGELEVAATTSNDLGVDCWVVDTSTPSVSQTCHVPLGSPAYGANTSLPIVALIDGGDWWVAIGASGTTGSSCGYECVAPPPNGGYANETVHAAPAAGYSVSTSVCVSGCSSAQGLEAYSYSASTAASQEEVNDVAALVVAIGVLWLGLAALSRRRSARGEPVRPAAAEESPSAIELDRAERRKIRRSYFRGLGAWAIAWAPLSLVVLFVGPAGLTDGWALVALPLGVLGAAVALPFYSSARSRLQSLYGFLPADWIAGRRPESARLSYERVGWTASFSYASWVAGGVLVLTALLAAVGADTTSVSLGGATTGASVDPGWLIVGGVAAIFVALRALFHYHLARAASTPPSGVGSSPTPADGGVPRILRTQVGAVLLTLNPLVGLLLGLGFQSVVPWSPYLLAWTFLPLTYLGIAVLLGCLGPSSWSWTDAEEAAPRVAVPSVASSGPS